MVAGCIPRGFLWAADGVVSAALQGMKVRSPALMSFAKCAIWAMPPVARDCPRPGAAMPYVLAWPTTTALS